MFFPGKPFQDSIVFKGWQEPTQVKHLSGLHSRVGSYPQTLRYAGKDCQGQTLKLITKINKLWP
jgi:hypothetical protein